VKDSVVTIAKSLGRAHYDTVRTKRNMPARKDKSAKAKKSHSNISFYPAWCKRCGNCVAFCPKQALETDEWGYPYMARPEDCISCHLCEKLCPDFAITVGEEAPSSVAHRASTGPSPGTQGSPISPHHSPERLAPEPKQEEDADE
jgi:2-oxoglutarate ferredoxin oxidoreductase subunit delta